MNEFVHNAFDITRPQPVRRGATHKCQYLHCYRVETLQYLTSLDTTRIQTNTHIAAKPVVLLIMTRTRSFSYIDKLMDCDEEKC